MSVVEAAGAAGVAGGRAAEVSVADLERRGLEKVRVLREKDLDDMVRAAVGRALAEGARDRDRALAEARAEIEARSADAEERRALVVRGEAVVAGLARDFEALEAERRALEERAAAAERETAVRRSAALRLEEEVRALRERADAALRRAGAAAKAAAALEARLARARAAARRAEGLEHGRGIDIGTANFVSAVQERDGPVRAVLQRNAFIEVPGDALMRSMLAGRDVPFAEIDGRCYVVGDAAFELARVLGREVRRPMARGIVSPREKDALPVMRLIIERLLGPPGRPGEPCVFSVPAKPVDSDANAVYHEKLFEGLLARLGYAPRPIREGHAVVLSDLAEDDFTGIGVSCGGGMFNVCVAYKAVSVLGFSTSRGGDWIDANVAQALGIPRSRATAVKESGIDIREPSSRESAAVAIYARELIRSTLAIISRRFESAADRPDFPEPVDLVFAGGTSLVGGFVEVAREELSRLAFPLPVKRVRLADDPLHAVSRGCLVMALSGTDA